MTVPCWCLRVAVLLPNALALVGDVFRKRDLGWIDKTDPRGQAEALRGAGARA